MSKDSLISTARQGQKIAAGVPNAKLVRDTAWREMMDRIVAFLDG